MQYFFYTKKKNVPKYSISELQIYLQIQHLNGACE